MLNLISEGAIEFVNSCRLRKNDYAFSSAPKQEETLYASCFAVMILHYTGGLVQLDEASRLDWATYINSWQREDGLFIGPELVPEDIASRKHSFEHISYHLTAHALPALELLGHDPRYPLHFAAVYTNKSLLHDWLEARDWRDAWLEGNNLLFIAQFLVYLRDKENHPGADSALELYFEWLDKEVDENTGLWGTDGHCSIPAALYGGYHQLLAYYYEGKRIRSPKKLLHVALDLQHADGGFHPAGGGGACEDVDAIDILVNLYKRFDYKRPQIRLALRRALDHVLSMRQADGGFLYRRNEQFVHMGIARTTSVANQSNLFPTWFRLHTLALIAQVLTDDERIDHPWKFNKSLSMGWHDHWDLSEHRVTTRDRLQEVGQIIGRPVRFRLHSSLQSARRQVSRLKRVVERFS